VFSAYFCIKGIKDVIQKTVSSGRKFFKIAYLFQRDSSKIWPLTFLSLLPIVTSVFFSSDDWDIGTIAAALISLYSFIILYSIIQKFKLEIDNKPLIQEMVHEIHPSNFVVVVGSKSTISEPIIKPKTIDDATYLYTM
jgi:hypothetical protein